MRYGYLPIFMNDHSGALMVMIMGERANLGLVYEICNWCFNVVENGIT
jgi:hypothetical protein